MDYYNVNQFSSRLKIRPRKEVTYTSKLSTYLLPENISDGLLKKTG